MSLSHLKSQPLLPPPTHPPPLLHKNKSSSPIPSLQYLPPKSPSSSSKLIPSSTRNSEALDTVMYDELDNETEFEGLNAQERENAATAAAAVASESQLQTQSSQKFLRLFSKEIINQIIQVPTRDEHQIIRSSQHTNSQIHSSRQNNSTKSQKYKQIQQSQQQSTMQQQQQQQHQMFMLEHHRQQIATAAMYKNDSMNRSLDHFYRYYTSESERKAHRSNASSTSNRTYCQEADTIHSNINILQSTTFQMPTINEPNSNNNNNNNFLSSVINQQSPTLSPQPSPQKRGSVILSKGITLKNKTPAQPPSTIAISPQINAPPSSLRKKGKNTTLSRLSKLDANGREVISINGKMYAKHNNVEYRMQLRRRSCCCTNCGPLTSYEIQTQSIVNPTMVRKKKRLTRVLKMVGFLNKMNKILKKDPAVIVTPAPQQQQQLLHQNPQSDLSNASNSLFVSQSTAAPALPRPLQLLSHSQSTTNPSLAVGTNTATAISGVNQQPSTDQGVRKPFLTLRTIRDLGASVGTTAQQTNENQSTLNNNNSIIPNENMRKNENQQQSNNNNQPNEEKSINIDENNEEGVQQRQKPNGFRNASRMKKSLTIIVKSSTSSHSQQQFFGGLADGSTNNCGSKTDLVENDKRAKSHKKHRGAGYSPPHTSTTTTTTARKSRDKKRHLRERSISMVHSKRFLSKSPSHARTGGLAAGDGFLAHYQRHMNHRNQSSENSSHSDSSDFGDGTRRHRRRNEISSEDEHDNSFIQFLEKRIKEAKKKRQEEEIKYVGKTPLPMLFKLLAQGKRDSPFDKEASEKRINQLISKKTNYYTSGKSSQQQQQPSQIGSVPGTAASDSKSSRQNVQKASNKSRSPLIPPLMQIQTDFDINSKPATTAAGTTTSTTGMHSINNNNNNTSEGMLKRERGFVISPIPLHGQNTFNATSSRWQNSEIQPNSARGQFKGSFQPETIDEFKRVQKLPNAANYQSRKMRTVGDVSDRQTTTREGIPSKNNEDNSESIQSPPQSPPLPPTIEGSIGLGDSQGSRNESGSKTATTSRNKMHTVYMPKAFGLKRSTSSFLKVLASPRKDIQQSSKSYQQSQFSFEQSQQMQQQQYNSASMMSPRGGGGGGGAGTEAISERGLQSQSLVQQLSLSSSKQLQNSQQQHQYPLTSRGVKHAGDNYGRDSFGNGRRLISTSQQSRERTGTISSVTQNNNNHNPSFWDTTNSWKTREKTIGGIVSPQDQSKLLLSNKFTPYLQGLFTKNPTIQQSSRSPDMLHSNLSPSKSNGQMYSQNQMQLPTSSHYQQQKSTSNLRGSVARSISPSNERTQIISNNRKYSSKEKRAN